MRATAIGVMLDCEPAAKVEVVDGIATVTVRGALTQYAGIFFDSYESLLARVSEAVKSDAKTVVLKVNSPGGDVFGMIDTARAMRALFTATGKTAIAYVEGEVSSAAYAIACSCSKIVATSTSMVGSVGVINTLVSRARQDAAMGLDVVLVTSGARKADGNPHAPMTEGAIEANQQLVDALAGEFFRWVKEARGLDAAGLEAGVFVGTQALGIGLVDEISDANELRETLRGDKPAEQASSVPEGTTAQARGFTMAIPKEEIQAAAPKAGSSYEEAVAALAKSLKEGDEQEAGKARKALKALLAEDKDESGDDDKKEAKAASDGDKPKDDDKKEAKASDEDKEKAKASSHAGPSALETETRARLIASRADLANDKKIQELFATCSLADLKVAIDTMPVASFKAPAGPAAGTVGKGQGSNARFVPAGQKDRLAEMMGLGASSSPRVTSDVALGITVFGGSSDQIAKILGGDADQGSK